MPVEAIGEALGGFLRILFRFAFELILEVLIRGAGYLICRPFSKNVDPDGVTVAAVGLLFWIVVAVLVIYGIDLLNSDICITEEQTNHETTESCISEPSESIDG